jgi:hypothetical protein
MARKYSKSASKDVERAMHKKKRGTLKSGSGKKVTNRKQAVAIGLSEARKKGKKVPRKRRADRSGPPAKGPRRRMPTGPFSSKHGAQLMLRH